MSSLGSILGALCFGGPLLLVLIWLAVRVHQPLAEGRALTRADFKHSVVVACVAVATAIIFPVLVLCCERGALSIGEPGVFRAAKVGMVLAGVPVAVAASVCVYNAVRVVNQYRRDNRPYK